jgi:hypothetical protein
MDPKELRGLMEAYAKVNAPQEELDEARPIYSRGGEQRRTQTPRQIGVKSAPHNIPRGGTTISDRDPQGKRLFTGDQDRGKGNKAARRAAALKNEELDIFDVVLEFLQSEGYAETLEEAEWLMANAIDEEAIGIILGEEITSEKGKAKAAEMIAKRTTASGRAKSGQGDNVAVIKHIQRSNRDGLGGTPPNRKVAGSNWPKSYSGIGGTGNKAARRAAALKNEEYVDEAQEARNNPEKYEAGEKKKYAPVRGERTPMPPRGDKRREDFEKWYAANVR